ncbi:DUF4058 family protein [Coleofasciculus sp. LEGE 07092]|uniref:DUF4058 family protein n=1 Tax=Coleofasciculus sp. LEGE 07092 TaxID=2777969 RepID=UPI002AD49584|nr:DUF4058 family protein [Coleofasciculus sp. LEGE 07092]
MPANLHSLRGVQEYWIIDWQLQQIEMYRREQASLRLIVVSHSETRPSDALYGFNLQDGIPEFLVPLKASEPEQMIDLKPLLDEIYDQGSYDLRIDYSRPLSQAIA